MVHELKKLDQIFGVYAEHAARLKSYSGVLWSSVDIKQMTSDVDETLSHLRSLKHLKQQPLFGKVEAEIAGFAESLPLMTVLKSDAIRFIPSTPMPPQGWVCGLGLGIGIS